MHMDNNANCEGGILYECPVLGAFSEETKTAAKGTKRTTAIVRPRALARICSRLNALNLLLAACKLRGHPECCGLYHGFRFLDLGAKFHTFRLHDIPARDFCRMKKLILIFHCCRSNITKTHSLRIYLAAVNLIVLYLIPHKIMHNSNRERHALSSDSIKSFSRPADSAAADS